MGLCFRDGVKLPEQRVVDALFVVLGSDASLLRGLKCVCALTHKTHSRIRVGSITEQRRLVRAALDAIPRLRHRMIELAFFSGMTNFEIAKEIGQSSAAVEDGIRCAMFSDCSNPSQ